jgi:hypothetical protein
MSHGAPSLTLATPAARPAGRLHVLAPVLVVGIVLALLVGSQLSRYHGNLTGFILFGHLFAPQTRPPAGALSAGAAGYDGQFFFLQAHDPFLLHDSTLARMHATVDPEFFRIQRLGYPLLALLLAGGQASALPATMLLGNVLVLLVLTAFSASWLTRRDLSPWWSLAFALAPGMVMATFRDLSDPLSTTCALLGVLAWQERRRWLSAVALTVAVLTLEVMVAVVAALAVDALWRAWRTRRDAPVWPRLRREGWPALAVPVLVFVAWQGYVLARAGGTLGTSAAGAAPFVAMADEVRYGFTQLGPAWGAVNGLYMVLTAGALVLALLSLRRGPDALNLTALVFAAFVVLPSLDDPWGATRLSAPLFLVLLADGLARRERATIAVCAAASAMTLTFLLLI